MPRYDEILKKVLNDTDIFDSPTNGSIKVPKLFEGDSWKELQDIYYSGDETRQKRFNALVNKRLSEVSKRFEEEIEAKRRNSKGNDNNRKESDNLEYCANCLKNSFTQNPKLLELIFENLEWYGTVNCKLPKMDSYGRFVENFSLEMVIIHFSEKIKSSPGYQQIALKKVLGYIKELYQANVPVEQIAYFVRKLDSLTEFWRIISIGNSSRKRG